MITMNVYCLNVDSAWASCQMSIEMKWWNKHDVILAKVFDFIILAAKCLLNA